MARKQATADLCICGKDTEVHGAEAAHWSTPFSSLLITWSCSAECGDAIEKLRVDGVLTSQAVNRARANLALKARRRRA